MLFLLMAFIGGLICSKWITIDFEAGFEQWMSTQTETVTSVLSGHVATALERLTTASRSPGQRPVFEAECPALSGERELAANREGLE
jgi:hypothetical protein